MMVNNICGTWQSPYPQKRDAAPDVCTYDNALTTSASSSITRASSPPFQPKSKTSAISRASQAPSPSSSPPAASHPQFYTTVKMTNSSLMLAFNQSSYLTTFGSYLQENCNPKGQNCTETNTIPHVYSWDGLDVTVGEVTITISFSQWEDANQLYTMEVLAAKAASNSGSNCMPYDKKTGECFGRRSFDPPIPCVNEEIEICHFTDHVEVVVNGYDTGVVGQLVSASVS